MSVRDLDNETGGRGEIDLPQLLNDEIEWQETAGGEAAIGCVAVLWSGEVLPDAASGGKFGPFYTIKEEAVAEAFRTALALLRREAGLAQVVCWHCAEPFAQELLSPGEEAYKRLSRFWIAPVRVRGVDRVTLPERGSRPPGASG